MPLRPIPILEVAATMRVSSRVGGIVVVDDGSGIVWLIDILRVRLKGMRGWQWWCWRCKGRCDQL